MITNYTGISGSRIAYLVAAEFKNMDKAIVVVSTSRVAERLAADLAFFMPDISVVALPEEEDNRILYEARNRDISVQRIKAMQALSSSEKSIVVAPISAVLKHTVSSERFNRNLIAVETGMRINPAVLREKLVGSGYEYSAVTEAQEEFSFRGGILDVFPTSSEYPVRIEFFDDEVDSIRYFDSDSQRSVENLKYITIGPAAEYIPSGEELTTAVKKIETVDKHLAETLEQGNNIQLYSDFIDYFDIEKNCLWNFSENINCFICDPNRIIEDIPEYQNKDE